MEAHTPKRLAIEKFVKGQGKTSEVRVRIIDQKDNPIVRLETGEPSQAVKALEVHTRQVVLENDEIDAKTKEMVRRWLASL
ncbi:MAG TPA: hypothetical protein VF283_06390 [Bryobacteraceae bacterium]